MTHMPIVSGTVKWPEDVAEIYTEIAEEDRHLAQLMWSSIKETWPGEESGMATVETRTMTADEFWEWANQPHRGGVDGFRLAKLASQQTDSVRTALQNGGLPDRPSRVDATELLLPGGAQPDQGRVDASRSTT